MKRDLDMEFMNQAYIEANKAYDILEAPVGAVVVKDNIVIGRGYNSKERDGDPTAHAEIIAIREACKCIGSWRLNDCSMYVTLEPCSMCAGAIIQARLDKIFIATWDPKAGAGGSVFNILDNDKLNHRVETCYGLMQDECSGILKKFFKELRKRKSG